MSPRRAASGGTTWPSPEKSPIEAGLPSRN